MKKTFRPIDNGCLNVPAGYPIGGKWYMASGSVELIVCTRLGPVFAAIKLVQHALATGRLLEMGDFISGSQTGFDDDSAVFSRPTRKFAARSVGIPPAFFESSEL